MPRSPSSITWYWFEGRWRSSAGKVTAGLAECNDSLPPAWWLELKVICWLAACTPGSAPSSCIPKNVRQYCIMSKFDVQKLITIVHWLHGFFLDALLLLLWPFVINRNIWLLASNRNFWAFVAEYRVQTDISDPHYAVFITAYWQWVHRLMDFCYAQQLVPEAILSQHA